MPQVLPTNDVNRWYQVRRGTDHETCLFFAERYFDSESDAFEYWERRTSELGFERVHRPLASHENPRIWAVCILPE